MPNINVRFTEQEHAELVEWAKQGQRSLQREIIWRLFTVEGNQAAKHQPAAGEKRIGKTVVADGKVHEIRTDFK